QLPFPGEQQMAVLYAISHTTPKPLAHHVPKIAPGLQAIIDKALEKDLKKRYQRIDDLAADLANERPLAVAAGQRTMTMFTPKSQPMTRPLSRTSIFIRQHGRSAFFTIAVVALLIPAALFLPALFKGKKSTVLSFDSTPRGATVLMNGDSVGVTPHNFSTTTFGELALRVQKQDYLTIDKSVIVSQGRDSSFSFVLQPAAKTSITVDPPDAEVVLNGKLIEPSRFADLQVVVGEYEMSVSRQGYETQRGKLSLQPGANPPLKFVLKKETENTETLKLGGVAIRSTPPGATVMIDGMPRGKTPFVNNALKPGAYDVTITLDSYEDFSANITVAPGKQESLTATLAALGGLSIISNPADAEVVINGSTAGTTPYIDQKIKVGTYQIVLRRKGYESYSTTTTVNPRQVNNIEAKLKALMGELSVFVKPFGSIYVDGRLMKKDTNIQYATVLPAGEYQLRAVHPVFGTWEKRIVIEPERRADFTIDFNRIVSLAITAFDDFDKPLVGQIYVDDEFTQESTPKQLKLRVGRHVIEVRRDGYLAAKQRINLENNLEEPLRLILKKE
ncbi:MAG: PEGA domain-containing protein, partial [Anaerolineae bacterium]|nr:PEGA domain-containing protein [Anaerolineae bacterium]